MLIRSLQRRRAMLTRYVCAACVTVLLCGVATAEVAEWTYKSPDAKWLVRVDWRSEAPASTVTVKQGDKSVWSYHPDPGDKPVRIFWRPDSSAFLMEHVTRRKECRLYLVDVAGPHLKMSPVSFEANLSPAAIVDGTVKWGVREGSDRVITLTMEDWDSEKRAMRITEDSRGALAGAAEDKRAPDKRAEGKAAPNGAAEWYEGFEGDRALLRKHLI